MTHMDTNGKTSLGLKENIEALLCYALGWVSGAVLLILEKENKNVRFHAWQSLITFLAIFGFSVILSMIPVFGAIVLLFLGPVTLVLWIVLMVKAYQGEKFKLPIVGDMADKQVK